MKNLFKTIFKTNTQFIGFNNETGRSPEEAETTKNNIAEAVDPALLAENGMRAVNREIQHIGDLSPEAGEIVGKSLPQMLSNGINTPRDAERLGQAATDVRAEITRQMGAGVEGSPEGQEYPPEAYAEVEAWLDQVQTQMEAAQAVLQAEVDANPDNQALTTQLEAFQDAVTAVADLRTDASTDLGILAQHATEGGTTGPLAERLAQVATGEVGLVNSDAEGNSKYTPGGVDQPWCADFANWCLEQAGGKGTGSSMAQSFVQGEGLGHVAIVVNENGTTVGGNEGNAVSNGGNANRFQQAISADDVSAGNFGAVKSASEAGVGDIVVRSRDGGPKASAADQNVT